jgi:hypothetical protein
VTPVDVAKYLAGQYQGLAYMRRLRAIEDEEARHLRELDAAWQECEDEQAWRDLAAAWDFRRINRLIAAHNEHFPVEASVPMNPRTGGYALRWQREPYDTDWILARFPPDVRAMRARREARE